MELFCFSSSIQWTLRIVLFLIVVNFNGSNQSGLSLDDGFPSLSKLQLHDEVQDPLEDIDPPITGTFLPGDEDELLAGLMDDFDLSGLPTQLEDLDDDFFGSGGGMEIEPENQENPVNGLSRISTDPIGISSILSFGVANGVGSVSGEHPYGEHPSRTLFVRNINSNVEDSELKSLFEVWLIRFKLYSLLSAIIFCSSYTSQFSAFLFLFIYLLLLKITVINVPCSVAAVSTSFSPCWWCLDWISL